MGQTSPPTSATATARSHIVLAEVLRHGSVVLVPYELRRFAERGLSRRQVDAGVDLLAEQGIVDVTAGPFGVAVTRAEVS